MSYTDCHRVMKLIKGAKEETVVGNRLRQMLNHNTIMVHPLGTTHVADHVRMIEF